MMLFPKECEVKRRKRFWRYSPEVIKKGEALTALHLLNFNTNYFAFANLSATASQFTTFQKAAI